MLERPPTLMDLDRELRARLEAFSSGWRDGKTKTAAGTARYRRDKGRQYHRQEVYDQYRGVCDCAVIEPWATYWAAHTGTWLRGLQAEQQRFQAEMEARIRREAAEFRQAQAEAQRPERPPTPMPTWRCYRPVAGVLGSRYSVCQTAVENMGDRCWECVYGGRNPYRVLLDTGYSQVIAATGDSVIPRGAPLRR